MRRFLLAPCALCISSGSASSPPRAGADSPEGVGAGWTAAMHAHDAAALERLTIPADLLAAVVECRAGAGLAEEVARWRAAIDAVAAKSKNVQRLELARFELKRQRVVQPGDVTDGCTAMQEIRLVDANLHLSFELAGRPQNAVESIDVIGIGDRWYLQEQ
jgi:hypothetical protein